MRCYDEIIDVRPGLVDGAEAPAQFLWRNRLWMVRCVQTRWVETGAWWDGAAARAVRGDDPDDSSSSTTSSSATSASASSSSARLVTDDDVLAEEEVWRVVAADGREGHHGVYELAHACSTGQWRLRTVMD